MTQRKRISRELLAISLLAGVQCNDREVAEFAARFGQVLAQMESWLRDVLEERAQKGGAYDGRN